MNHKVITIFVVDDNEDDVLLVRAAFEREGLMNPIHTAPNGEAALAWLRGHHSGGAEASPALVLLDINMPGKNGFEVLEEIKRDAALKHLPVIMLTTSKQEEDVVRAYAGGACTFISKPVGIENFRKLVRELGYYWTMVARVPGAFND